MVVHVDEAWSQHEAFALDDALSGRGLEGSDFRDPVARDANVFARDRPARSIRHARAGDQEGSGLGGRRRDREDQSRQQNFIPGILLVSLAMRLQ